jgi:hypothetical protein
MGCGTFSAVVYVEERCGGPSLPAKSNKRNSVESTCEMKNMTRHLSMFEIYMLGKKKNTKLHFLELEP